jgi:hypothetical protein
VADHTKILFLLPACDIRIKHESTTNSDPLPSWNEGESKEAIRKFIASTTNPEIGARYSVILIVPGIL